MKQAKLTGLIAATYTPMDAGGEIHLGQIGPMVDYLAEHQVDGLYVCGSTGEGISLTSAERRSVAQAFVEAAKRHGLPTVVQVGHNSLREARDLAKHAADIQADAISANAPSYFKINDVDSLVSSMQEIAAGAPSLGFYYYHIPHLTGANVDMLQFLEVAADRIPNLAGIKFTAPAVHQYQECLEWRKGQCDALWGSDEMLLAALAVGCQGAVGSTYNLAAPLYKRIMADFDNHDLVAARKHMSLAVAMIRILFQYPFHSATKAVLEMLGVPCGDCRLPLASMHREDVAKLRSELDAIGFFQWCHAD